MYRLIGTYILFVLLVAACNNDDGPNLPPYEERVSTAINSLQSELMTPAEGWKLEYKPVPESGVFLVLMEFTEKEVRLRSDVGGNNGQFFDQTIPYRIDNALGLELIFETYCVFSYLFEQDQATFGAEFEFLFKEKVGENLVFESKTDVGSRTQLEFEPANSNDEDLFSRDIAANLDAFSSISPKALSPVPPQQQIVLEDLGVSVFWSLDNQKRNVVSQFAGEGTTVEEIIANGGILLNHSSGYALFDGFLVLQEPLLFSLAGQNITLERIALTDFDMSAPNACPTEPDNAPRYRGFTPGIGDVTMLSTLLSSDGQDFQPNVYTVNAFFIFDGDGNSLLEDGVIGDNFPDASGFAFLYGVELTNPDIPMNSVGLILDDGEIYLREFEPTTTDINRVEIILKNNFYHSGTPKPGDQQKLIAVTDEIFAGGITYAFDLPITGITVHRLFNPCNQYEVFLVE
ncbi:MAG: hypothetical protein DHS20C17_09240 [Cyclobacteriaceae bacterium]|nr:MAG: hypothetical protein DHS20C17_09240 [Cyclobacteriaceae bacterium]